MLPDAKQFLKAKNYLAYGSERALLAYYATNATVADMHKVDCIDELKKAATALGFELVQRVMPAARDDGRMDVEVDTDA